MGLCGRSDRYRVRHLFERVVGALCLDDDLNIKRNPHLVSLVPMTSAMQAPAQSSSRGRPLPSLSLAFNHAMGGLSPITFRLFNVTILAASALTSLGIVRRTVRRWPFDDLTTLDLMAAAAAAIWLAHPLQTEVVGYVTQRTESMMGLCYLLTLYASIRAVEQPTAVNRWSATAVIVCGAGMACKESMVTAPVAVLLYDAAFENDSFRAGVQEAIPALRGIGVDLDRIVGAEYRRSSLRQCRLLDRRLALHLSAEAKPR